MKSKGLLFLLVCIVIGITACDYLDEDLIQPPLSQEWGAEMEYDDSGAVKSLNVAAVCLDIDPSPEINRNKIVAFIDKIKSEQPDVRLILFSETTLGYYYRSSNPAEYQQSTAETIPGETTGILSAKAAEHKTYISFGMAEKSGEDLYNSQVLIGPDGTIVSVHHKNFFTPQDKESGFKAGQDITVDVIDNIKVATIICRDIGSLEVNKRIHASGAELVLHSSAEEDSVFIDYIIPHQYTYTWILGANRTGNEDGLDYDGTLYLTTPSGERRIIKRRTEGYIYGVVKCY